MTPEQRTKEIMRGVAYIVSNPDDCDIDPDALAALITQAVQSALDEQRQQIITLLESAAKREDRLGYIATRNSLYAILDTIKEL